MLTMRLVPRGLQYSDDWDALRRVRNECAPMLTHFRGEIDQAAKENYRTTFPETVRHYLFEDDERQVVGFARLEWRDGYVYPSYGLAESARGKGYGWHLVKMALLAAGGPLRGDFLVGNDAIERIDLSLGWRKVGQPVDGIQAVECDWPPPFVRDLFELRPKESKATSEP